MKKIRDLNIKNSRVLIRVDYNVPIENNQIKNYFRINASLPTLHYCLSQNASIVLMTHLGRPKGVDVNYSVEPIIEYLEKKLNTFVHYSNDCISQKSITTSENMLPKEIHLLENLRFYKEEQNNDLTFSRKLSKHADIYINDAFGLAHRKHSSNSSILSYYKNKCIGLLMEKEFKYLGNNIINTRNKCVFILGGTKISTKINLIENFLKKSSHILIGGAMAFTFIKSKGINVGKSLVENNMINIAKKILLEAEKKKVSVLLPVDVVCSTKLNDNSKTRLCDIDKINNNEMGLDIGPETCTMFNLVLESAKHIVWNGPLGAFEHLKYATGTQSISSTIQNICLNHGCISIVGGGDTISAIESCGSLDGYSHLSTGGGASLKLLSGKTLEIINSWNKYA